MATEGARVGLVLGAGGVTGGAFHAGVLAALEAEVGWDPRRAGVLVGTSAGSVTASTLRAGLSGADLLARAEGRPLSPAGRDLMERVGPPHRPAPLRPSTTPRPPAEVAATLGRALARPLSVRPAVLMASLMPEGAVTTDAISKAIGVLFPDRWPAEPLWLCAVRQSDGRRVVFGREARPEVPDAVAASCAIPGYYAPVEIDGDTYIDGAVHSPTNADVLADAVAGLELDVVVVSSPMSRQGRQLRPGVFDPVRAWAGGLLDGEVLRLRRRGVHVVLFEPSPDDLAVMGSNAMDPDRRAVVARHAFDSTRRHLDTPSVRSALAALA